MEEFRQQIVDRSVLNLVNKGQIRIKDFDQSGEMCIINENARKKLIAQILRRLDTRIQYKNKKYKFSSIIISQAQNLVKYLNGESDYEGFYLR